jgi:hypothetical protein
MEIDKLNLQELTLKRHPLGYFQMHGKFRDIVPAPIDEYMRHGQIDLNGIKVELYQTGFQVLVMRDCHVVRIGDIIEKVARHKPRNFLEKIKEAVKEDVRKFIEEDLK